MKKLLSLLLVLTLLLCCVPTAMAESKDMRFDFVLSVDGSQKKEVRPGDIITVVFNLNRTDSTDSYDMYAMQNEIRYDGSFFELVDNSALLSSGISSTDIGMRDSSREFYMNYVSLSGGQTWEANRLVGSFQLKVIAETGVSQITCQDYLVSTRDGSDHYEATAQDVTVVVSGDCTVRFDTNGGSEIPSQTARYGEKLTPPDAPTLKGFELEGWYRDIDLQEKWDFDNDTVQGNMTLYARWTEAPEKAGIGLWWLWLLLVLAALLLLLWLLLGKKTVHFRTDCDTVIPDQKVKKGEYVQCPQQPVRLGRTFAGWYSDELCTKRWSFETDTVKENMTLYAKWL